MAGSGDQNAKSLPKFKNKASSSWQKHKQIALFFIFQHSI
jgi:hypothetical protein